MHSYLNIIMIAVAFVAVVAGFVWGGGDSVVHLVFYPPSDETTWPVSSL